MKGLLPIVLLLSSCALENVDVADRFAIDYQATKFSERTGFKRHVCEILSNSGRNTCWGLLDHGVTAEFECWIGASSADSGCELVRRDRWFE